MLGLRKVKLVQVYAYTIPATEQHSAELHGTFTQIKLENVRKHLMVIFGVPEESITVEHSRRIRGSRVCYTMSIRTRHGYTVTVNVFKQDHGVQL